MTVISTPSFRRSGLAVLPLPYRTRGAAPLQTRSGGRLIDRLFGWLFSKNAGDDLADAMESRAAELRAQIGRATARHAKRRHLQIELRHLRTAMLKSEMA